MIEQVCATPNTNTQQMQNITALVKQFLYTKGPITKQNVLLIKEWKEVQKETNQATKSKEVSTWELDDFNHNEDDDDIVEF